MIITRNGIAIRMEVEGIREAGRSTRGVKLINLLAGEPMSPALECELVDWQALSADSWDVCP
jgi:DNA gyrase/topoisomerase IV subunit A